jgi:hypothetical protein
MEKHHAQKEKHEIRGKTESDIEDRFLGWQQANAGTVRNVVRGRILRLTPRAKPQALPNQPTQTQDAFFMIVEYETTEQKPRRTKD